MNTRQANDLAIAVAEIRGKYDDEQLVQMHTSRTAEDEFAKIGYIVYRNRPEPPRHELVTTGYQWATNSPYLVKEGEPVKKRLRSIITK